MPLYIRDTKWFPQKLNQIEEILKGSSLDCLDLYEHSKRNKQSKSSKEAYEKHQRDPF